MAEHVVDRAASNRVGSCAKGSAKARASPSPVWPHQQQVELGAPVAWKSRAAGEGSSWPPSAGRTKPDPSFEPPGVGPAARAGSRDRATRRRLRI